MQKKQEFQIRNLPRQKRSQETFDLILKTTALLLEEVGFDKLNTNLICERAKITPPGLYRYFPNKYSILEELGKQLMDVQNACSFRWMERYRDKDPEFDDIVNFFLEQYQVTYEFEGAKWIMRSLRSVPKLAQIRFDSHNLMNSAFTEWSHLKKPELDVETVARRTRISNEVVYALIEMLLDGSDDDAEEVFKDAATMFTAF